jgi:hypothetical protein
MGGHSRWQCALALPDLGTYPDGSRASYYTFSEAADVGKSMDRRITSGRHESGNVTADGTLAARTLVQTVIEHQMDQILWHSQADHRQGAKVHEKRSISIEGDELSFGVRKCETECQWQCRTHGADNVEVLWTIGDGVKIAADESARANNDRARI